MGISHAGTHFGHFLKRTEIEFPSGSGQNGACYYSSCGKLHPPQDLGVTDPYPYECSRTMLPHEVLPRPVRHGCLDSLDAMRVANSEAHSTLPLNSTAKAAEALTALRADRLRCTARGIKLPL